MNRSTNIDFRKSIIGRTCSIALGILFLSLTGCGSRGEQGPTISTTAAPIGSTASLERDPVVSSGPSPTETTPSLERDLAVSSDPSPTETTPSLEEDPTAYTDSPPAGDVQIFGPAPRISTGSTPNGATANLDWDPIEPPAEEPPIVGYYVHYGKQSSDEPGSCSYKDVTFVTTSNVTVTDLDRGSRYYFAVSAYNGVEESSCSEEVPIDT